MTEQELQMKFAMFEQQIQAIQQQLQAVEQAIVDLSSLNVGMEELIGKKDSEIMAPIGRGIYAKAKLLSEDLIVDVGGKNFVNKSIPKTKELISEQLDKLGQVRDDLNCELEKINSELTNTFMEHQQKMQGGEKPKDIEGLCGCGEECQGEKCGDDCKCEGEKDSCDEECGCK